MRILKNILHLTIVLALLTTAFPMLKGDVNLDERLDLADAVLSVRGLVRSVDSPAAFEKNVENALISLAAAARMSQVINNEQTAMLERLSINDSPYLVANFIFSPPVRIERNENFAISLYHSIDFPPPTHPPRTLPRYDAILFDA